jgi:hypothetical protein
MSHKHILGQYERNGFSTVLFNFVGNHSPLAIVRTPNNFSFFYDCDNCFLSFVCCNEIVNACCKECGNYWAESGNVMYVEARIHEAAVRFFTHGLTMSGNNPLLTVMYADHCLELVERIMDRVDEQISPFSSSTIARNDSWFLRHAEDLFGKEHIITTL